MHEAPGRHEKDAAFAFIDGNELTLLPDTPPGGKPIANAKTKRWASLMRAWNDCHSATRFELASRYTRDYPDNVWGWVALADVLTDFARYDAAREVLARAQKSCSASLRSHVFEQWGHFHRESCNLPTAEKWYRRALVHNTDTRTLVSLGALLARQERFSEAKRHLQLAIGLATHPLDEAYYHLGLVWRGERRYPEALRCFRHAIKIDSQHRLARQAQQDVAQAMKVRRTRGAWFKAGPALVRLRNKGRIVTTTPAEKRHSTQLFAAWGNNDRPATAAELSTRFTEKYGENVLGWIILPTPSPNWAITKVPAALSCARTRCPHRNYVRCLFHTGESSIERRATSGRRRSGIVGPSRAWQTKAKPSRRWVESVLYFWAGC